MAEAQRFAIALVACVFFLSSLPFVSADANSDNGLSLEISSNDNGRVYFEGEILQIQSILVNYGDSTDFQENPACEVYIDVKDENNLTVFSNLEQCRDQTRKSIISNSQIIEQENQLREFKNFNGYAAKQLPQENTEDLLHAEFTIHNYDDVIELVNIDIRPPSIPGKKRTPRRNSPPSKKKQKQKRKSSSSKKTSSKSPKSKSPIFNPFLAFKDSLSPTDSPPLPTQRTLFGGNKGKINKRYTRKNKQ